jgi:uncharacterized protein HemX
MTKVIPDFAKADAVRIGPQPIAIAAAALIVIVLGIGMALLWRAYTGSSREQDRDTLVRLLRAQATQASEQLAEKTNSLETTQQEAVDQLQVVQDQLQTVRRLLAAQQIDTKRLSEQVEGLTSAIDSLRQSFASAQPQEASHARPTQKASVRSRSTRHRKHAN